MNVLTRFRWKLAAYDSRGLSVSALTILEGCISGTPLLSSWQDGSLGNFRTLDGIFEDAATKLAKVDIRDGTDEEASVSAYLSTAAVLGKLPCVGEAMRFVCEVKGGSQPTYDNPSVNYCSFFGLTDIASDLVVYRYSQPKFIEYLIKKATRLSHNGIVDKSLTLERELAKDGLMDDGKEELLQSGRLKLACDLISQYVPPDIHEELLSKFNFSALTAHTDALQAVSVYQTATANGVTQKLLEEQEQERDGKKRKASMQTSRGVEKLKKASVKGMAKLSTFFQKGPKT
ncbi:hypothetical protein EW145_g6686 [Phellinidium pouzarii]|uniref:Ribonuclease H2 subunit B wHTH domain-containing protein n=1 Tax=Phellinidium pouzarii TaxID=167371 RepID=A0A4S4KVS9_9AGAM|nr:hypothetical protein EW145_g6686 [Phellinidium pouzarii]